MQKWPYADFKYLSVGHFRSPVQKYEYLTLEAVFPSASENAVMFFDHYANEYKSQRSELDEYLLKLGADGWKLNISGDKFEGKSYLFRRLQFRRAIK